jgi:peptidoglycan/LPS O-acetylase OafA/YrhL
MKTDNQYHKIKNIRNFILSVGTEKLDLLLFFDGIAIFFIVIDHAIKGYPENPLFFLNIYLEYLGLTLFTFSAGYKLFLHHAKDLNQKVFLGNYFTKRFIRLYKPYLGYSLLVFFPVLLTYYCANVIFHLSFPGSIQFFTNLETMTFLNFLSFFAGNNFVSGHLWYLVGLIGITSICFSVLYFLNIKSFFYLFFPFILVSSWIQVTTDPRARNLLLMIFILLPYFIFGAYWADNQHFQRRQWFQRIQIYCPIILLILVFSSIFLLNSVNTLVMLCFYCILFPFFLFSIAEYSKKIRFLYSFFIFSGVYAFQIYLFHLPLILRPMERLIIDVMKINYFFVPIVLSVIAIFFSVIAYKIVKKAHLNFLIE